MHLPITIASCPRSRTRSRAPPFHCKVLLRTNSYGLIQETEALLSDAKNPAVLDAGLIGCAPSTL